MVTAHLRGVGRVDKKCIIENFGIYFEKFNGMGEKAQRATAFHECGHYIVRQASERLIDTKMLAVSIMPAEDYLGVTCYEPRRDKVPFKNREYFIDSIAADLAGRVAEKIYCNDVTSGARSDLQHATCLAYEVITKYGITVSDSDNTGRNMIFLNTQEYPMFSDKRIESINREVQKLLDLGYKRAEDIINAHRNVLEALVEALMEKKIMSASELERVWKSTEGK